MRLLALGVFAVLLASAPHAAAAPTRGTVLLSAARNTATRAATVARVDLAQLQAPAVVLAQACTEATALAVFRQTVFDGTGVPIGIAAAYSCTSVAEAAQQLARQVTRVQAQNACWYHKAERPDCEAPPQEVVQALE